MSQFVINGGQPLNGEWKTQGMKNAATPIVAATLLTEESCVIRNVPRIADIEQMLALLETLGADIRWEDTHTLHIQTKDIKTSKLDYKLAKSMRSSVLLLGPLLARLGTLEFPEPGGCNLGNRSLDTHFSAMESFGADISTVSDEYYTISSRKLQGGTIELAEKSVTATENAMMVASRIPAKTVITNVASEPHIVCLAAFLRSIGAEVSGEGTREITIVGTTDMGSTDFEIIPDQLEVGTIAVLGALTHGSIAIHPVVPKDMHAVARVMHDAGVRFEEKGDTWVVHDSRDSLREFFVATAPAPGFPTDLQAPFGVLATQAHGTTTICDPLFENRLGYLGSLEQMGATVDVFNEHAALVTGPTPLHGAQLQSLDLRAGATLLIAGLIAEGKTIIDEAGIIDRGYERIDERLRELGADISRVE